MKNKIIIGIFSVVFLFFFLFVAYTLTNKPQNVVFENVNVLTANDHLKWSKNKKEVLVEYSDLQCPACKSFHEIIKSQIESDKAITDKVTFVYRHFPLPNIHKNAEAAAYAAEAAGKQGKFYEMVDLLFDEQDNWKDSSKAKEFFTNLAKKLKLDSEKFAKDIDSKNVKDKVAADVSSGNLASVNATPTFYLNGAKLDSIRSFEEFVQLLKDTAKEE